MSDPWVYESQCHPMVDINQLKHDITGLKHDIIDMRGELDQIRSSSVEYMRIFKSFQDENNRLNGELAASKTRLKKLFRKEPATPPPRERVSPIYVRSRSPSPFRHRSRSRSRSREIKRERKMPIVIVKMNRRRDVNRFQFPALQCPNHPDCVVVDGVHGKMQP